MGVDLYNQRRECFAAFIDHTNQKEKIMRRLQTGFPKYAPTVARAIAEKKQVNLLDIGPGAGHSFLPFSDNFRSMQNVSFLYEEPNIGMELLFFFSYLGRDMPLESLGRYQGQNIAFANASHSLCYPEDWEKKNSRYL